MTDGPRKAMTPDLDSLRREGVAFVCDRCGGAVRWGDWPFCKGNPKDHER